MINKQTPPFQSVQRVFVGGLGPHTTVQEIRTAFEPFGRVFDVHLPGANTQDQRSGRGFGFVTLGGMSIQELKKRVLGKGAVRVGTRFVDCKIAEPSGDYQIGSSDDDNNHSRGGEEARSWLRRMEKTRMVCPRYYGNTDMLVEGGLLTAGRRVYQRDQVRTDGGVGKKFYALSEEEAWRMACALPDKERDLYETISPGLPVAAFQDVDGHITPFACDDKDKKEKMPNIGENNSSIILSLRWQQQQRDRYLQFMAPAVVRFFAEKVGVNITLRDVLISDSSGFGFSSRAASLSTYSPSSSSSSDRRRLLLSGVYWKPSFHWIIPKIRFKNIDEQRRFWQSFRSILSTPSSPHSQNSSSSHHNNFTDERRLMRESDMTGFSKMWEMDNVYTRNRAWRMAYSAKRTNTPKYLNEWFTEKKKEGGASASSLSFHRPLIPLELDGIDSSNGRLRYRQIPFSKSMWQTHSVLRDYPGDEFSIVNMTKIMNERGGLLSTEDDDDGGGRYSEAEKRLLQLSEDEITTHLGKSIGRVLRWAKTPRMKRMRSSSSLVALSQSPMLSCILYLEILEETITAAQKSPDKHHLQNQRMID